MTTGYLIILLIILAALISIGFYIAIVHGDEIGIWLEEIRNDADENGWL